MNLFKTVIFSLLFASSAQAIQMTCASDLFDSRAEGEEVQRKGNLHESTGVINSSKDNAGVESAYEEYTFRKKDKEGSYTLKVNLTYGAQPSYWLAKAKMLTMNLKLVRNKDNKLVARSLTTSQAVMSRRMMEAIGESRPVVASYLPLWETVDKTSGDEDVSKLVNENKIHQAMELAASKGLIGKMEPYYIAVFCRIGL